MRKSLAVEHPHVEGDSSVRAPEGLAVLAACLNLASPARAQAPGDTLRLDVDDAVRFALRDGVEAAIARQDVAAAEAQVGVARSYALPELSATGTYTRNVKKPVIFFEIEEGNTQSFEIGEDNAWLGALRLNQTLYAFGRVRSGYRSAKEYAAAARLAGDNAAAAIARDVRSAYYLALLAREQKKIAHRSVEQARRNVDQIAERVARGVTPEFDRLRAEVALATRVPMETRATSAEAIALESLKRLLGVPLERPVALTDALAYAPYGATIEEAVERALAERSDLAALRRRARAAELFTSAQAANDRPLLSLDGNLSWQGETSDGLWPQDNQSAASASVGLALTWPLLDGFRNKYRTREAGATARRASLEVRRMEDVVTLEARTAWLDLNSIAEEIDGARHTVELARRAHDIARVRYEKGLSTLLEYLDAELALLESELSLSETLFRYNVAMARMRFSTGEGPGLSMKGGK
jgi:outer membrane protein TolC